MKKLFLRAAKIKVKNNYSTVHPNLLCANLRLVLDKCISLRSVPLHLVASMVRRSRRLEANAHLSESEADVSRRTFFDGLPRDTVRSIVVHLSRRPRYWNGPAKYLSPRLVLTALQHGGELKEAVQREVNGIRIQYGRFASAWDYLDEDGDDQEHALQLESMLDSAALRPLILLLAPTLQFLSLSSTVPIGEIRRCDALRELVFIGSHTDMWSVAEAIEIIGSKLKTLRIDEPGVVVPNEFLKAVSKNCGNLEWFGISPGEVWGSFVTVWPKLVSLKRLSVGFPIGGGRTSILALRKLEECRMGLEQVDLLTTLLDDTFLSFLCSIGTNLLILKLPGYACVSSNEKLKDVPHFCPNVRIDANLHDGPQVPQILQVLEPNVTRLSLNLPIKKTDGVDTAVIRCTRLESLRLSLGGTAHSLLVSLAIAQLPIHALYCNVVHIRADNDLEVITKSITALPELRYLSLETYVPIPKDASATFSCMHKLERLTLRCPFRKPNNYPNILAACQVLSHVADCRRVCQVEIADDSIFEYSILIARECVRYRRQVDIFVGNLQY